jgi:phosphohistidine phosphatase
MITLYLLRHGKASKTSITGKDYDRPLNTKGIAQINQIGFILDQEKVRIDHFMSSAATRTAQTADIMHHYLKEPEINFTESMYLASSEEIYKQIVDHGLGQKLLYVGHNFGISDLASFLVGQDITMSTGAMIEISFNFDQWREIGENKGKLVRLIQPSVHIF